MATWIGHLRIAEGLLPHFPELDRAIFAYGNRAPDFGRPLEDNQFSPPKDISHYLVRPEDRSVFDDLRFYREHLDSIKPKEDLPRYSFLLGYFFHLVSDGLWGNWIGQACKRDFADMIEEMGEKAWWEMKDDWYGLDVQFARDHPDSIFWTEVMKMKELPQFLDFQDMDAVEDQVKRIQKLNSDPPPRLVERAEFPYLSAATMDRYVEETVQFLLEYWKLLRDDGVPDGVDSFVGVFPEERFVPYNSPLGEVEVS